MEIKFNENELGKLLTIFENQGCKGYAKIGEWQITNGGYDLWWEIYYNNIAIIGCVDGVISNYGMIKDSVYAKIKKYLIDKNWGNA